MIPPRYRTGAGVGFAVVLLLIVLSLLYLLRWQQEGTILETTNKQVTRDCSSFHGISIGEIQKRNTPIVALNKPRPQPEQILHHNTGDVICRTKPTHLGPPSLANWNCGQVCDKDEDSFQDKQFLFLVTPPYHGSTALEGLLASSPSLSTMCHTKLGKQNHCEGIPKLLKLEIISDKWDEGQPLNWIEDALPVYRRFWNMSQCILLDKSPPNVFKVPSIARDFSNAELHINFVFMTRSPCHMSNTMHNHMERTIPKQKAYLRAQMEHYKMLLRNKFPVVHVRYEDFFWNLEGVSNRLLEFMPCLQNLDPHRPFSEQGTHHNNGMQERSMSVADYVKAHNLTLQCTHVSSEFKEALQYFGYA